MLSAWPRKLRFLPFVLSGLILFAPFGCKKNEGGGATAESHGSLFAALPASADVLITVDLATLKQELTTAFGTKKERGEAMLADLSSVLKEATGADLLSVSHVTIAVSARDGGVVAAFPGLGGQLKAPSGGRPFVQIDRGLGAIAAGDVLLVGNMEGLMAAARAAEGKAPNVAASDTAARHKELAGAAGAGLVVATSASPLLAMARRALGSGVSGGGLTGVAASITKTFGIKVVLTGDGATLSAIEGLYRAGMGQMQAQVQQLQTQLASQEGVLVKLAAVLLEHSAESLPESIRWSTSGEQTTITTDVLEGGGYGVATMAILAAIAIPAFIKYQRRAKTTEAIEQLDRMYKGAAIYYATPKINVRGERLPCQFPASQAATPVEGTCCASLGGPDNDGDGRCDQTTTYWDTNTWAALSFQITDQHYFTYAFDSNGQTGPNAQFTASAYGDLDCDSIMSTFQRMGFGDPTATAYECSLQGSAAFYVEQETE